MNHYLFRFKALRLSLIMLPLLLCLTKESFATPLWDDWRLTTHWFSTLTRSEVSYQDINLNNQMKIPYLRAETQWREDLRVYMSPWVLTLRPRLAMTQSSFRKDSDLHHSDESSALLEWNEAFLRWDLTEDTFIVYGVQNFQWGPAESFSPSNGIFKETAQQRTLTYQLRGKHLIRLNHSWRPWLNTVLLAELSDNSGDEIFLRQVNFRPQILQKTEFAWNSGANYVGFVVGEELGLDPYWGEYFNFSVNDEISFYGDLKHQKGSQAWYPKKNSSTQLIELEQMQSESKDILSSFALGLRYSLPRNSDLRYEYIYFEPGYTRSEQRLFRQGLLSTNPLQQIASFSWINRVQGLGVEFPGQQFSYLSLRIPDLAQIANWNFSGRTLVSHNDGSLQCYFSTDWAMGEAGTWTIASLLSPNSTHSELGIPAHSTIYLGYDHVW